MIAAATAGYAQVAGRLVSILNDIREANASLTTLQQAAEDALTGRTVSAGTAWATIAERYDKAARTAKEDRLPSEFTSENMPSPSDLSSCAATLNKLRAYNVDLLSAKEQGNKTMGNMDQRLAEIPRAKEALKYLVGVHEKLASLPVRGQGFALDLLELDRVSVALNGLDGELRNLRRRYAEDLKKLDSMIERFQANLRQFSCG
jgi:hypothetical protein